MRRQRGRRRERAKQAQAQGSQTSNSVLTFLSRLSLSLSLLQSRIHSRPSHSSSSEGATDPTTTTTSDVSKQPGHPLSSDSRPFASGFSSPSRGQTSATTTTHHYSLLTKTRPFYLSPSASSLILILSLPYCAFAALTIGAFSLLLYHFHCITSIQFALPSSAICPCISPSALSCAE